MFRYILRNLSYNKSYALNLQTFKYFSSSSVSCCKFVAKINFKDERIELNSRNGFDTKKTLKFPFLWLRDNCKCEKCFHKSSQSRIINWETFDVNVKPKDVMFDDKSNKLKIIWNDVTEHESEFAYEWLNERNFTAENQKNYLNSFYRPSKILLSKQNFMSKIEQFDFQKVVENDLDLYNWLHALTVNGVAMINNVPETENEARKLSNRVAFIRKTHYGEEYIIKAREDTSNVAYLSENLQMHTDLPYYEYAPGVNLLHYLVQTQSTGAQNLLVDGFYVAQKMQEEHPKEFEILSKILVNWSDIGEDNNVHFHSVFRAPMIFLDYDGNVCRINHSIPQRDSFFSVPIEDVQLWYRALGKFIKMIYSEAVEMKAKEGTILTFDNTRMIHGRKRYEDTKFNQRYVIGAFLDWDEIFSRYRVLQKKFQM